MPVFAVLGVLRFIAVALPRSYSAVKKYADRVNAVDGGPLPNATGTEVY